MNLRASISLITLITALVLSACGESTSNSPTSSKGRVAAAPAQEGEQAEDARLAAFFEEVFERQLAQSPQLQSQLGMRGDDYGRLDDYTDEFAKLQNEQTADDLRRLREEFDFDALSGSSRVSYMLFEYSAEQELKDFPWRHHEFLVNQMRDISGYLATFMQNIHGVDSVADAEAYISRLRDVERVMNEMVPRMREQAEAGIIAPKISFPIVTSTANSVISGAPFDPDSSRDAPIYSDLKVKIDALEIDQREKDRLISEGEAALTGPFLRGYRAFIAEAERIRPNADNNNGIWRLPDGADYYANRIRTHTTTDMSADELHDLGLAEVARIRSEMDAIRESVDFGGDLAAFFEFLRSDPGNYFENTDAGRAAYLADATALIEEILELAPNYFNVLPEASLEVRRVEPWRENSGSTAFYDRPAPDGSRPGIYYVNMRDMRAVQKSQMNSLAYHEGAPGHHFQLAIQQELSEIPRFRRFGGYTVYSEGWALYAERLAFEMGLYEGKPLRDFGRLSEEMKRAVRLVVDTGIHSRRWTRQEAIDYMRNNTPMAEADIVRQIDRYIVNPGQALAYKVGMLKILELRQQAMDSLGDDFDIREFHDVILRNGALPIPILERLVQRSWQGSD